ncbi:MAG: hypothetical protein WCK06_03610 [Actinomycetota bacterium]
MARGLLTTVLVIALAGVAIGVGVVVAGSDHTSATTSSTAPTVAATTQPSTALPSTLDTPAICGPVSLKRLGEINYQEATELSGLAVSSSQPGLLWTHNDSGDRARVIAVRTDGSFVGSFDIPGAESLDAEDIAIGPGPDGGSLLYLADIGDNDSERSTVVIWRVAEPTIASAADQVTPPPTRIELRYPDGPHNAETLLVDPRSGDLAVVTKSLDGRSSVYVVRSSDLAEGAIATMERVARIDLGFGELATGGDVSGSGSVIVVRTYGSVFAWKRKARESIAAAMRRPPCRGVVKLGGEGQGEAIALTGDGLGFYTVAEGSNPPIRLYSAKRR